MNFVKVGDKYINLANIAYIRFGTTNEGEMDCIVFFNTADSQADNELVTIYLKGEEAIELGQRLRGE